MKLTLVAAALALAASAALAQGYGYGDGPGPGYGPGWGRASLSTAQRDKIAAIRGQMRTEMFKLRDMQRAGDVDSVAYHAQLKKVGDLREQMFKSRELR